MRTVTIVVCQTIIDSRASFVVVAETIVCCAAACTFGGADKCAYLVAASIAICAVVDSYTIIVSSRWRVVIWYTLACIVIRPCI